MSSKVLRSPLGVFPSWTSRVRIEFEYERHGTLCLIGNLDVMTGEGKGETGPGDAETQECCLAAFPGCHLVGDGQSVPGPGPARTVSKLGSL